MTCHNCCVDCKKFGTNRNGSPRFRCRQCGKTYTESQAKAFDVRIPEETGIRALSCLVEGMSVTSTSRITGVNKRTILSLLKQAGDTSMRLFEKRIKGIAPTYVQCDEIWGFVGMKEKYKKQAMIEDEQLGDAYTFVGIDADTKLVLCWELGKRNIEGTIPFIDKLRTVTDGCRFQLTTDAMSAYAPVIEACFGANIDYAQLIKILSSIGPTASRSALQPRRGHGNHLAPACRASEDVEDQHVLHRTPESHDAHVHASAHATDQWVQQEVGKSQGRHRSALRLVQLRARASDDQNDASSQGRAYGSRVDAAGNAYRMIGFSHEKSKSRHH